MRRKLVNGKLKWVNEDKPNVKVKNATRVEYDGIRFRSKLEAKSYQRLKEEGFNFEYEVETYTIIEKFEYRGEKVRPITFTPDFIDKDRRIILEIKGFANESYPLRAKLFKRYLTINRLDFEFHTVRTIKDLELFIEYLKTKNKNEKAIKRSDNS